MPKLKGLLDTAKAKLTGLLGDFPQGFNAGAVAGFPGWAGDMAYMADTARLALTGADQQAAPENYVGTTDYIAKQAGYPVPQTLSGQLGAAVGGLVSPGPGDLAKFAPLGAMFLGAKAKTAMPDVLEYAQAMEKAGKSADEIWQTTGKLGQPWFKGADGKWRFEIDDSRAFLNDDALIRSEDGYEAGLSEVMSHPQLAESYAFPERFATTTNAYESPLGMVVAGNYRPTELTLDFSPHQYAAMDEGVRGVVDPKQDSVFLHELQHSVQQREGFGQGGNPDQMASEYARAKNKWIAYSDAAQLYREAVNNYGGNLDKAAKAIREAGLDADQDMVNLVSQLGESVLQREAEASAQLNAMRDPFSSKVGDIGLDLYKRLAGEAEARNVQARMNLTMDERLALPPWATQDVPTEQQIVRFGDGASMAIEDFAARRAGKAKPYKEAMGVDTMPDMNNKSVYHRATQSADSPMQGAGYAMFADGDPARVDGYGEHRWVASGAGAVDVGDIQKDIVRALRNSRYEWEPEYQATAASLAREANPDDIVNSAGIWDSPRLVDIIYRDVLDPRGIKSVRTNDGLIIFDPRDAKAVDGADGM